MQPRIEFQTQTTTRRDEEHDDQPSQGAAREAGVDYETREYVLSIGPARDYDHGNAATKATEHASWPESYKTDKSFAVTALRDALPDTLMKKGLCYWNVKPAAPDSPRDGMRQRLERKQQIPGQMAAVDAVKSLASPKPQRGR